jgi:glutamate synthase (NADH)
MNWEANTIDIKSEESKTTKLDKVGGFMKYSRRHEKYRPVKSILQNRKGLFSRLTSDDLKF